MKKVWIKNGIQTAAAIVVLFVAWLIAYLCVGNPLLIPAPWASGKEFGVLLTSGGFWQGFALTMGRVFLAFAISFVLAAVFAVIAYLYPTFAGICTPIVSAFRSLPVLAIVLILLSVLGAGVTPIAVAFLSLFPMLYTGIFAALSSVDKQLIDVGRACGVTVKNNVFRVYVPLAAPYVTREGTAAFSFALKLVVSAEVVANTARSLGGLMQEAQGYLELPKLFALVIVTFFVALVLETVGNWLSKRVESALK